MSLAFTDSIALELHGLNTWAGIDMPQNGASYPITVWIDETTQYQGTYQFPVTTVPDTSAPDTTVVDTTVVDTTVVDRTAPDTTAAATSSTELVTTTTAIGNGSGASSTSVPGPTPLPSTGRSDTSLALAASTLVALGALVVLAARRRPA